MTTIELKSKVEALAKEVANATDAAVKATKQAELDAATAELKAAEEAEAKAKTVIDAPKSIDDIVADMKKNSKNKFYTVSITNVSADLVESDGKQPYYRLTVRFNKPLIGSIKQSDGTYKLGFTTAITLSHFQIETVMRRSMFFGRFVDKVDQCITSGFAGLALTGLTLDILSEFVAAGELKGNPFTRNVNSYEVADHDRFIYHVVGISNPTDANVLVVYKQFMSEMFTEMAEQRKLAREAAARQAELAAFTGSTAPASDDIPF